MTARRPGAHRDVSRGIGGRDSRSPGGVCPRSEQRFRDLRAQLIARLLPRGPQQPGGRKIEAALEVHPANAD